ncbi:hypothetical protein BDN67DRAFT_975206 [Paxillus ammoniavirescens]|nr:hypothetical protein BDN67DRAFT_975206 [Paxillus ammoniavirescens]
MRGGLIHPCRHCRSQSSRLPPFPSTSQFSSFNSPAVVFTIVTLHYTVRSPLNFVGETIVTTGGFAEVSPSRLEVV